MINAESRPLYKVNRASRKCHAGGGRDATPHLTGGVFCDFSRDAGSCLSAIESRRLKRGERPPPTGSLSVNGQAAPSRPGALFLYTEQEPDHAPSPPCPLVQRPSSYDLPDRPAHGHGARGRAHALGYGQRPNPAGLRRQQRHFAHSVRLAVGNQRRVPAGGRSSGLLQQGPARSGAVGGFGRL